MTSNEYAVDLTVGGRLQAWQQGAQTFEQAQRELGDGLVVAAQAINGLVETGHDFDECLDLGRQWWTDLDLLPSVARRLVLTRMVVAGIREPERFVVEEA